MSLDDLNRQLYSNNQEAISARTHETSDFDPANSVQQASPFNQNEVWQKEKKEVVRQKKKKVLIICAAVFSVLILVGGGIFLYSWWQKNAFHQDRVEIYFEGPKEADSTQPMKYVIHYKNNNHVALKNVELQLTYSENFQPTDNLNLKYLSPSSSKVFIEDIKSMSEGTVELNGIFYAPKDSPVFLRAALNFTPSSEKENLSVDNQISVNITAAPMFLSVVAPQNVANGDALEYVVDYKNLDVRSMGNMQVRIDFPQGFQTTSAEPQPSEKDAYWYIGNLESNQGGKITIKGNLSGGIAENKKIIVSVGQVGNDGKFVVFNKQESNTQIASSVLNISQMLEGRDSSDKVIQAGDTLKYIVSFINTGDTALRNAIVTAEVKGRILDFSKLETNGGAFNSETGIITWKASDVPILANIGPQTSGEIRYSIPVKSIIPVDNELDKNFVVTSVAKIDSPDIPTPIDSNKIIASDKLEIKLASKVLFDVGIYHADEKIENSGPVPLETGSETTFAVHWSVVNVSNEISEAKVVASLPSGVRWTGTIYPTNEKIVYNERTNQIVWEAGDISAGTGILSKQREVVFQIGVTPQSNQIGQALMLVNKSTLTTKDTFTERDITINSEERDTQLPEDSTVGYTNGKVVK